MLHILGVFKNCNDLKGDKVKKRNLEISKVLFDKFCLLFRGTDSKYLPIYKTFLK